MIANPILLQNLLLKNFATFEDTTIHFHEHFNTIIGETGSGKSLILDALQLILGNRADKKYIRNNAEFAIIEATFKVDAQLNALYFDALGHPCDNDELIIKRIIYKTGTSKSFMNFQQCPLSVLQNFSQKFIDLVGQFENQKLLDSNYQINLIDIYAKNSALIKSYKTHYANFNSLQQKLEKLTKEKQENIQKKDFLEFQINEYQALQLQENEEETLNKKKEVLVNFEENQKKLLSIQERIDEGRSNLPSQLSSLIIDLHSFDSFSHHTEPLERARQSLEDISYEVSNTLSDEVDDAKLTTIIDRLDKIQKIKRKYNLPIHEIGKIIVQYGHDLSSIDEVDMDISRTQTDLKQAQKKAREIAEKLHTKRVKVTATIEQLMSSAVRELNMQGATIYFELSINKDLGQNGISQVKISAETNPGEGIFPIKQIASGGELSRILLAFRQVLASKDTISIFLFDEIDTGIGGETAMKIGDVLKKVATDSQVIAITHLPQIAHFADQLLDISKESLSTGKNKKELRTFSKVSTIEGLKEKEHYVKRMVPIN